MSVRPVENLPEDRDEQAAGWCLRLAEARLAPDEQRTFDDWLADPDNARAFDEAVAIWDAAEMAADKPELIRARSEALDMFRKANGRRWLRPARRWTWAAAGIAATIALVVLSSLLFLGDPARSYETGIGERQVVMLEDGSRLSLDADTQVEVRMHGDRRQLTLLSGRAKFDVARDPLRPFSVAVGDKVVVATGTSFSVELVGNEVRVLLYEGHVDVLEQHGTGRSRPIEIRRVAAPGAAGSTQPALVPGRELVTQLAATTATVMQADPARSLSWEAGQLSFENEALPTAVARMNRYSRERLVIGDSATGSLRVDGVFTAGDTDAFVEGLTALYAVRATRQGDQVRLTRR